MWERYKMNFILVYADRPVVRFGGRYARHERKNLNLDVVGSLVVTGSRILRFTTHRLKCCSRLWLETVHSLYGAEAESIRENSSQMATSRGECYGRPFVENVCLEKLFCISMAATFFWYLTSISFILIYYLNIFREG